MRAPLAMALAPALLALSSACVTTTDDPGMRGATSLSGGPRDMSSLWPNTSGPPAAPADLATPPPPPPLNCGLAQYECRGVNGNTCCAINFTCDAGRCVNPCSDPANSVVCTLPNTTRCCATGTTCSIDTSVTPPRASCITPPINNGGCNANQVYCGPNGTGGSICCGAGTSCAPRGGGAYTCCAPGTVYNPAFNGCIPYNVAVCAGAARPSYCAPGPGGPATCCGNGCCRWGTDCDMNVLGPPVCRPWKILLCQAGVDGGAGGDAGGTVLASAGGDDAGATLGAGASLGANLSVGGDSDGRANLSLSTGGSTMCSSSCPSDDQGPACPTDPVTSLRSYE